MANIIEITIKGVDKTSKAFKSSEKATKGLKDALGGMVKVAGGAAAVAVTLKKAWDLGRAGGVVLQTAESFEFLIEKLGATPDLLDRLTEASRGTISEQKLMAGTMTLLAGASGELGTQLANQTPQLMEIAKAANKLNPALGDTAFMYQSIATGVKRASPMILDNLGLTIKVGEANEKYAKKLGKTVDQLTAEEKSLALLNATLEAGDVLINQVGGSTESATDSFDQLAVIAEETGDSIKARLYPILLDAAEALKLLVTWSDKLDEALEEHEEQIRRTSDDYQGYRNEMDRAAEAAHHWTITTDELSKAQEKGGIAAFLASKAVVILSEAEWELFNSSGKAADQIEIWRAGLVGAAEDAGGLTENLENLTEAEYLMAATEALIAGDYVLAQHFVDLAYDAELTEEKIRSVISALDALDGKDVTARIMLMSGGFTQGEIRRQMWRERREGTLVAPTAGTVQFRGQTFQDAYWSGDTLMVRGQVYGTFPGRRQHGGPVSANMPYLVGEKGPEVFVPDQSGQVEPMTGLGIEFNFYDTVISNDQDVRNLAYEVVELLKG